MRKSTIVRPILKYEDSVLGGKFFFTSFKSDNQKATFQYPVETNIDYCVFHCQLVEVWAIYTSTGEILAKYNPAAIQQVHKANAMIGKIQLEIIEIKNKKEQLESKKKQIDQNKELLSLFKVVDSRFHYKRIYSSLPNVEISEILLKINNNTGQKVFAIYFKIESIIGGRSGHTTSNMIGCRIVDGIEPETEVGVKITPYNIFIPELQNVNASLPRGENRMKSTLILTGIEVENGKSILDVDFPESDQKHIDDLEIQLKALEDSLSMINVS